MERGNLQTCRLPDFQTAYLIFRTIAVESREESVDTVP